MLRFLLLLAGGSAAFAQQYTITTVAGGAPPATPASATSVSIGQPRRVTLDSAGNLYFSSGNAVFKMNGSGVLSLVAGNSRAGFSGDGGPAVNAQLNSPQGIALDAAGNLYIADSFNNRVRIVNSAGVINTFAGNGNVSPGGARTFNDGGPAIDGLLHLPMGVATDKSGNVYIADTGDNSIRLVTTDGTISSFAGDSYPGFLGDGGNAVSCEFNKPSDVTVDSSGNVYVADTANAAIRKITTDGLINTIAGNEAVGFAGDGGAATSASLLAPVSVAVDSSGNVFILQNGDGRIRKVDSKSNINTVVGSGTLGFGGDGTSTPLQMQMNSPTGLTVDSSGNLYVADSLNLRIRKIASSGGVSTIAGNGVLSYSGDGGPALSAQMNAPQAVAVDSAGNLYVADSGNNVVRKISKGIITTIAGTGSAGSGGDNGAAATAQLNSPQGVAVDSAGNVYIADTINAKVRKVTPGGTISTVAGNGTPGFGGDGGAATSAQLYTPVGVAVDSAGNLYIADFGNGRIRKVSAGGTITTVAGNGNQGYSGDGGPAANAQLAEPQGVAVDAAGNLYIADTGNSVVRLVSNGLISTFAGNGYAGFAGDGAKATIAQLANPGAIAVDAGGNVFISDGSARVRQIVYPTGIINTVAGTGLTGYSGDGGAAVNAQLNSPAGVALDASGNVYIADTANNAVRSLQIVGAAVTASAVVNGASNQSGAIAPGEVVVIYGSGLGPGSLTQFQLGSNGLVPTLVAGTSVVVNGALAPVLYTSSSQVAAVVPFEVSGSQAQVSVVYQGRSSQPLTVNVAATSPAIFTANSTGTGPAAALNLPANVVNDASHPASAGTFVTFYLTGVGQTNPSGQNGLPGAVPLPQPLQSVTVTIGGQNATVNYAGGAPGAVAGITQVNAQIPTGLSAGAVPLVVKVGSTSTQNGVTIAVSGN